MSDFRQFTLGTPGFFTLGGTGNTTFTLDQTTDQLEWVFQVGAQDTGTVVITRLGYLGSTLTGTSPTFKISVQGVDMTTGFPDGTIKGGGSPASKTFTVTKLSGWNWLTLDNAYTASRGEYLAIVIAYSSGTIDASNKVAFGQFVTNGPTGLFPYSIGNNAGVRAKATATPIYGFASATRTYGFPMAGMQATTFSSDTTPDEVALRFQFDAANWRTYQIVGARINIQSAAAGKTAKMILYDGTTVLQDVTVDSDVLFNQVAARPVIWYFDEATLSVLNTGQVYRLAIQAQETASSWAMHAISCAAAGDLDAYGGGRTWFQSTRVDVGAWTDVLTVRPLVEPIIQDVQSGLIGEGSLAGGLQ